MSKQVVPFPLPLYLSSYFSSKITNSEIIDCYDGTQAKPLTVKRDSSFGKFIYRCLSRRNKAIFLKEGYTFFIEVAEKTSANDKFSLDARYSYLELKDEEIKEITVVFKSVFETALFNFVAGSRFAIQNFTNKKRGYLKLSILEFCNFHGVKYTSQNLMAWEQAINRATKKSKKLTSSFL